MFQRLTRILSKRTMIALLCSLTLGLAIMLLFSGKSRIDLEAIVVSPNEDYLACFETGRGHKILCFCSDGSLAFDYDIPSDVSGGGHCALWFDENVLCVFFYKTHKVVQFAMDGTILKTDYNTSKQYPPEFPSFIQKDHQYIYEGNKIEVVYTKGSFWEYWIIGSERSFVIITEEGDRKVIYSWTAKDGITNQSV